MAHNPPSNRRDKPRGSTHPAGRPRRPATGPHDDIDLGTDLVGTIDKALTAGHPLPLLKLASGTVSAMLDGEFSHDPFFSLEQLLESFLDIDLPQTDALLLVLAEMNGDGEESDHIRREVAQHASDLPDWLHRLGEVRATRAIAATRASGPGEDFFLEVHLPTGQPLTLVVYVDRSDGPTIAEAYGIDRTLAEVIEVWTDIDEAATDLRDIAPADARARILDAIEGDVDREPPTITENWPSEKALLEWVVDRMPEGGAGYEAEPDWMP